MKPPIARNNNRLPVGLHLVEITHFDMLKTETGQIAMKGGSPKGLQIKFKEVGGDRVGTKNFPISSTMMWLLENISKALNVDLTGEKVYSKREMIGKKLYIMVIIVRMTRGGVPIEDVDYNGRRSFKQYTEIGAKFFAYDGVAAPCPIGDPSPTNPTGWYLQFREEK